MNLSYPLIDELFFIVFVLINPILLGESLEEFHVVSDELRPLAAPANVPSTKSISKQPDAPVKK